MGGLPLTLLPRCPGGGGTHQLVVVDDNELHILGLAVHGRVGPAGLRGGNQSPPRLALARPRETDGAGTGFLVTRSAPP